jgi:hypothetical protein
VTTDVANGVHGDGLQEERALADHISETRLRKTVRDLVALGPRMGGTPSGDAAAAYVARAFAGYGLDVDVIDDPPVDAYWADAWEVRIGTSSIQLESAWPYRRSPSASIQSASLVRPGSSADAAARGSGGQIAYSPRFSLSEYTRVVRDRSAVAAILTSEPHHPGRYVDWASIGELPVEPQPAIPVFALSYNDGRRVDAAAEKRQPASVRLSAHARRASPKTVIATLPGRTSQYFIVSAHGDSDSGGPGADDNASGVAVVLELARVLSGGLKNGAAPPLPVTLRFMIFGQEIHSAQAYIDREGRSLEDCLAVINLDEVGTGADREAIYAEGNDVPWNRDLLQTFERVGREYLRKPGFWPEFATTPSQGGTDGYAFLPPAFKGRGRASRRIPSVTVYTAAWDHPIRLTQTPGWMTNTNSPGAVMVDYSRYYHSSGDTPENTTEREPQNMLRAAKLIGITLLRQGR